MLGVDSKGAANVQLGRKTAGDVRRKGVQQASRGKQGTVQAGRQSARESGFVQGPVSWWRHPFTLGLGLWQRQK